MFKFFNLRIATETEVQALINNTLRTAANIAQGLADTSKQNPEYSKGCADVCSEILLIAGPPPPSPDTQRLIDDLKRDAL